MNKCCKGLVEHPLFYVRLLTRVTALDSFAFSAFAVCWQSSSEEGNFRWSTVGFVLRFPVISCKSCARFSTNEKKKENLDLLPRIFLLLTHLFSSSSDWFIARLVSYVAWTTPTLLGITENFARVFSLFGRDIALYPPVSIFTLCIFVSY